MTQPLQDLDVRSFQLGMINCFAEMVAVGVKRLAISPPLTPAAYEEIRDASEAIVKWSILYFKEQEVLGSYLALKASKGALEAMGAYSPRARQEISRTFMQLLSYPERTIEEKIRSAGKEDPFMLIGEE